MGTLSITAAQPCVTYSRVSTDDQVQAYGLTSQRHELRELARRKGYPVAAEFSDEGISGATLDRPALTQLRDGVRDGRYRVVLVHAPDRLARTLVHQLVLLEEFKRAGARVEFLTTPAEDTAEGRLLLNVSGVIAEFEREKIRERTLRGKREKARRGLVVSPASAPFGYRPDPHEPGRLQVHEPEAEVVRLIYRWVVDERRSLGSIVRDLRQGGIRAARGGWGTTQVRRILSESIYRGEYAYNRRHVHPDGLLRERDRADWIVIPVPAIVTAEQHAAARAQLTRNRELLVGRPPRLPFLLRGLLVCATCGRKYRGVSWRGRRRHEHREQRSGEARCTAWLSFQADALEVTVRETLAAALRDPQVLRQGIARWQASRGATDVELRSRVAHLERQLAGIRRDERRLIDLAVGDGEQQGLVEAKLRELARQRGGLAEQLRQAEARVAQHEAGTVSPEAAERLCARARRGLDRLTAAGWRALLEQIVDEIRVNPDRTLEIRGLLDGAKLGHTSPSSEA
jgi:site-specific DNA recombinase